MHFFKVIENIFGNHFTKKAMPYVFYMISVIKYCFYQCFETILIALSSHVATTKIHVCARISAKI